MLRIFSTFLGLLVGAAALAGMAGYSFSSIDGGQLNTGDWAGQPILVVNTASRCGYTYQYEGLQTLYDTYKDRGLVVLAVPSDDFRQELGSAEEVKNFCELTFGLDLPMTDITHVRGADAHPFYLAVAKEVGFTPSWNFNKVLIGVDGGVAGTWRSSTRPMSPEMTEAIETQLK